MHPLYRISVDPTDIGTVTTICNDVTFPASIGQDPNASSLTFNDS